MNEPLFRLIEDGARELLMIAPLVECEASASKKRGTWNVTDNTGLIVAQYRDGSKIWPEP